MATAALATAPPPSVAFIVTGQCRASPSLLHINDTYDSSRAFLSSYVQHVLDPHGADASRSTVFILLTGGDDHCATRDYCDGITSAAGGTSSTRPQCVQAPLDHRRCAAKLKDHKCFNQNVIHSWTPLWCTMWLSWQYVSAFEANSTTALAPRHHERVVFSRIDQLYSSSMGRWSGAHARHVSNSLGSIR